MSDVQLRNNRGPVVRSYTGGSVACVAFIAVCAVGFQWPAWSETPVYAVGSLLTSVGIATVGTILLRYRNMRPLAITCITGGFLWSLQWLSIRNESIYPVIGYFANVYFWVVAAAGFLLTPRVEHVRRFDRALIYGFLVAGPLQFLVVLTSRPEWNGFAADVWWPTLLIDRGLYEVVLVALCAFWASLAVGMAFSGYQRIQSLRRLDRFLAIPVVVGYCGVGLVASFSCVFEPFPPPRQNAFYFAMSLVLLFIPISLVVAASTRTLRRLTLTAQLNKRLSKQVLTGDVIRDEFRELLGDETLSIFYWSEINDAYVDQEGHIARPLKPEGTQFVIRLSNAQSEPMAIVVGDSMLVDHTSMLDAFLAASSIAIENVQLQASVKAQLELVRASRARIVEATLEERRRIERDLHDGVQQRLLALQARIGASRKLANGDTQELLQSLSIELHAVLQSLRELAQGIHPTELRQFGVKGALEVVAERLPIDIRLQVTNQRFSAAIESTLYFVVCEALTNIVKHANATQARVLIEHVDGNLVLDITDNGCGGAKVRAGGGLEGIADRLRVLGGDLVVSPAGGAGSRLLSKFPIAAEQGMLA